MSTPASSDDLGRRLRGSDTGFLYVESESQTSACTHVAVLEAPAPGRQPLTPDELRDHVEARLDRLPHLRRRLVHVPGGIGHPVWADDPGFDLDAHLHHATLAAHHLAAGDPDEQLHTWLAEVSATHLPLDRPVWELTLVDGFDDGSQALVLRVHHVLVDGAAMRGLFGELLDDLRVGAPTLTAPADALTQRAPWGPWLFLVTFLAQCWAWLGVPWLLVRTMRAVKRVRARRSASDVPVPDMAGSAPVTVLNRSADTRRRYARLEVDLADLTRVKEASGAPLSDVVVAVVAGGLRTHLTERDALPDVPLVVNVPMGNDRPGAPGRVRGNAFVNFYAHLPTDLADPRERLAAVRSYDDEARLQLELQGRDLIPTWLDRIPPAFAWPAARRMAVKHREDDSVPDYNVLVSNVVMSNRVWQMDGRRVRSVFLTGPVMDGYGLNVTVTGYAGRVTFALHSNPASVESPGTLAAQLRGSLDELLAAYAGAPEDASEVA